MKNLNKKNNSKKVILIIRDGWGYSTLEKGNATIAAKTPNTDFYTKNYPFTLLKCTGEEVGLPEDTQGGSEVGHLTIGAGRTVLQSYLQIDKSIKDNSFFNNKVLLDAINHVNKHTSQLHLMGLFSDKGVHATTEHLYALLELAKKNLDKKLYKKVFVHCFLDGRDVAEKSCNLYLNQFNQKAPLGKLASLVGRYYAMDRDNNWDRTEQAYHLLTEAQGICSSDPCIAIEEAYDAKVQSDYYIKPIALCDEKNKPIAVIQDNDAVIFFNFRTDRARQLTDAFINPTFKHFKTKKFKNLFFCSFTHYDKTFNNHVAFHHKDVTNNLGKILAVNNKKQLRIAETEKYAHVTFFFNSQIEKPNKGEDRIMVPSPKVPNYAQQPEMSAYQITQKILPEINKAKYDFIAVNFANPDLVGHSANYKATIKACEIVDACIGKIVDNGLMKNYVIMITGDHGNCEEMFFADGTPKPSHTLNPVQFHLVSNDPLLKKIKLAKNKGLSNIAPTVLKIMGIKAPREMNQGLL